MTDEELAAEMAQNVGGEMSMPYDFDKYAALTILKWLRGKGFVQLPAEWYIAEDGDGDPVIWRPNPLNEHAAHTCLGIRFMAGNAKIEKPVADWLWENIRKGES